MSDQVFGNDKKGSIRDIPIPGSQGVRKTQKTTSVASESNTNSAGQAPRAKKTTGKKSSKNSMMNGMMPKVVLGAAAIIVAILLVSFLGHKAKITVTSKTYSTSINSTLVAGENESESDLALVHPAMSEKTIERFVPGTQEENVQTRAQGRVIVYNNDSETPKRYIQNTRFQTPDGRVYRTPTSFVVPGKTNEGPGSTEIVVVADVSGEEYNEAEGLTFKLPGLESAGDVYDLVTAEQSTAFTGGYSGIVMTATRNEVEAASDELRAQLEQELQQEFIDSVSTDLIVTADLIRVSNVSITETIDEDRGGVVLQATGQLESLAFNKEEFEEVLAERVVPSYTGHGVDIADLSELSINVDLPDLALADVDELSFSLVGSSEFVWEVDEMETKTLLAGKKEAQIKNSLVSGIDTFASEISVSVSPFWRGTIPNNTDRIDLTVTESSQ